MSNPASLSLRPRTDINPKPLGAALLLIALGALYLARIVGPRQAALFVVGALLGVTLYHAAFGFTSAWRVFIADGRGAGLRAQMLMLAVGVALFFPALDAGTLFGNPVKGLVRRPAPRSSSAPSSSASACSWAAAARPARCTRWAAAARA
jgi:uncharacterized membrane protein YedE/YeeE